MTEDTLTSTTGVYLEDKSNRSKKSKQHLDNLVSCVTALNTECGYGIILVASAQQPRQGPKARSLNIVLPDKDGHAPTFNSSRVKPKTVNRGTMCVKAFPDDYVRKLTPTKDRTQASRVREQDPTYISPFGTSLDLTIQRAESERDDPDCPTGPTQEVAASSTLTNQSATQAAMLIESQVAIEPNGEPSAVPQNRVFAVKSIPDQGRHPPFKPPARSNPTTSQSSSNPPFRFGQDMTSGPAAGSVSSLIAPAVTPAVSASVTPAFGSTPMSISASNLGAANNSVVSGSFSVIGQPTIGTSVSLSPSTAFGTRSSVLPPEATKSSDSGRTVAYNPISQISITGLGKPEKSATPNISLGLPSITCGVCGVERRSRHDVAYR